MPVVVSGSFTPSPAARACTTLKADVASYVLATNNARALAKAEDFLRSAVDKLNTRDWEWNKVYQSITLVANTVAYDLASVFKTPRDAQLLDSNSNSLLKLSFSDPKTFWVEYYDRDETGDPTCYTVENGHEYGQVTLNIKPSSTFVSTYPTLRLWYYQRTVPCGGSTTSLDVPSEVADWVMWQAKADMAAHFDQSKIGYAQRRADDMWDRLVRDNVNSQLRDWEQ